MKVKELIKILTEFPMETDVVLDIDELRTTNTRDIKNIHLTVNHLDNTPVVILDGDWGNTIPEQAVLKHFKV